MITQAEVKYLFDYCPTGKLLWKNPTHTAVKVGSQAGVKNPVKYAVVYINAKSYLVHKLIYLWHTGEWPKIVDHIDNDKRNNKIENLRAATASQNMMNRKGWSGRYKGVYPAGDKWAAKITVDRRVYELGTFDTEDEAFCAYKQMADKLHGEFAKYAPN